MFSRIVVEHHYNNVFSQLSLCEASSPFLFWISLTTFTVTGQSQVSMELSLLTDIDKTLEWDAWHRFLIWRQSQVWMELSFTDIFKVSRLFNLQFSFRSQNLAFTAVKCSSYICIFCVWTESTRAINSNVRVLLRVVFY